MLVFFIDNNFIIHHTSVIGHVALGICHKTEIFFAVTQNKYFFTFDCTSRCNSLQINAISCKIYCLPIPFAKLAHGYYIFNPLH